MRTLAIAAFAASLAISGSAFADAIATGNAHQAPVFVIPAGTTSQVADIGNASRAPVYAVTSSVGQVAVQTGSAHQAPLFALVAGSDVHLAQR